MSTAKRESAGSEGEGIRRSKKIVGRKRHIASNRRAAVDDQSDTATSPTAPGPNDEGRREETRARKPPGSKGLGATGPVGLQNIASERFAAPQQALWLAARSFARALG